MSARTNHADQSAPKSTRALAFGLAALFMLVPANMLPVLSSKLPGEVRTDTIYSGTVHLVQTGLWPIALIVFVASIMVPFLKLGGLLWLLWAVRRGTRHPVRMTKVFRLIDEIGRWSMLDVFLVAFLAGAVEFGGLASVEPRLGILAFAAAVVLTMLATHAFNPRLLWERPDSARSA
ncbi:paraquat-inducible protein A [Synoicihabitans lomoniglobus]|uniref:Paraquat-inducible protein A n=1 Tax=Synoicihabitans lomoniglobus TaxID=2909285 RepID=A0AAE9ZWK2_9BACT|nr:paraquat-inducible protein A [Opitutaceae bacterium LMO-M01]WED65472.1 paraquat-inducible protein A [Opitutaceae bacterium LMO-M01]